MKTYRQGPTAQPVPMTVRLLRELLGKQPQDAFVILDSDAEGNRQMPLLEVTTGVKVTVTITDGYGAVSMEEDGDAEPAVLLTPYD